MQLRILCFFLLIDAAWGIPFLSNIYPLHPVDEFLERHEIFNQKICREGDKEKFNELFKAYKGEGIYLPFINDQIDFETIRLRLPQINEKLEWIKEEVKKLSQRKDWPKKNALKPLILGLKSLMEIKKAAHLSSGRKKKLEQQSSKLLKKLHDDFYQVTKQFSFLLSFKFPVDHLDLRRQYEQVKNNKSPSEVARKNGIYLLRKILEDGSLEENNSGSDLQTRSLIDQIYINLANAKGIISEDLRFDLSSLIKKLERVILGGRKSYLIRLNNWKEKVQAQLNFYNSLLNEFDEDEIGPKKYETIEKKFSIARNELKDYVLTKQAETYEFWSKQNELMKSLFVLQTILMNEVGGLDGEKGIERKAVAQVVLNRMKHSFYSSLSENDDLYPYLKKLDSEQIAQEKLLNVLFKEGEFSFTYFFIPASAHLFCPDFGKAARYLRRKNLFLAFEILKKPQSSFKGMRYFSRISMLGRINMTSLWDEYQLLPERPGHVIKLSRSERRKLKKGRHKFLYAIKDEKGKTWEIVELGRKTLAVDTAKKRYRYYRNPHYFKYFVPKESFE